MPARQVAGQPGPDRILPASSPATVNLDGVVQLRMGDGLAGRPPVSCYTMIKASVDRFTDCLAIVDKERQWTYAAYFQEAVKVAKAFIELGLERHRTVAILGSNSPEWSFSVLGAVFAGGLATGVYTTNTPQAVFFQLKHSKANIAVVEDEAQLQKILPFRDQLPDLRAIVMWGEEPWQEGVISWQQLLQIGQTVLDSELDERLRSQAVNQPAVICYTSGTTALPKGALLSQDNITWTCASAAATYRMQEGREVMISFLPLSHIVAQVSDIWIVPSVGGTVHFAEKDALRGALLQTLVSVRPTRFVAVPRVLEKLHSQLEDSFLQLSGLQGRMLTWARGVASEHVDSLLSGGDGVGARYQLAEKLVLSPLHARLGLDRCVTGLYSGAAPLAMESIQFLKSIGLVVSEIYGMTENPNQTANLFDPAECAENNVNIRLGSVGRSAAGCQTKLHLQDPQDGVGEVAAHGRNVFMGYLSDPASTREAFDRGFWLLTGDMATLADGFLTIRGRIKDVIITSGGKNIAPYPIEERIKQLLPDFISHCMVVGDRQKHLACLLTVKAVLDPLTLEVTDQLDASAWEWCLAHGCRPHSVSDLASHKEKYAAVYEAILGVLERVNRESSSKAARVNKFCLLPCDFSIAGGELGPTMKVKRHAVELKYRRQIEEMYAATERTSLWDA